MYAVVSHYEDSVEIGVQLVDADKIRKFCLKKLKTYLKDIKKTKSISSATEKEYPKYKHMFKHACKELICIRNGEDPTKLGTYEKYPLQTLINLLMKETIFYDDGNVVIKDVVYADDLSSIKKLLKNHPRINKLLKADIDCNIKLSIGHDDKNEYVDHDILTLGDTEYNQKKNLYEMFKYIYYQFVLDHDKMKELYEDVLVPINFDHDEVHDLDLYSDLSFFPCQKKDHKYIYGYVDEPLWQYYDNNNRFIKELDKYFNDEDKPKKLKLGFRSLVIINNCGVNKRVTGVKYLDWRLHYWPEYRIDRVGGITFDDLIIAAYKVRSHKFENHYEWFCSVKDVSTDDGTLRIELQFADVDYYHR